MGGFDGAAAVREGSKTIAGDQSCRGLPPSRGARVRGGGLDRAGGRARGQATRLHGAHAGCVGGAGPGEGMMYIRTSVAPAPRQYTSPSAIAAGPARRSLARA